MQLFCPTCQVTYAGMSRCPKCSGLLLMPHEATTSLPRFGSNIADIHPTPLGRVIVGTIVALGIYLGLRRLATAYVLAFESDPEVWWVSVFGLGAVFGCQAVAAIIGAVLAAAGRTGGFAVGAAVGALCGGGFLGMEFLAGAPARDIVFYLQPLILATLGGVAGAVGTQIWVAAPILDMPTPADPNPSKLSSIDLQPKHLTDNGRPTQWARILAGAMVIVLGFVAAEKIRHGMQKYSGGILQVQSLAQGHFMSWQMATFAVLIGGGVAAAGTGAGIRHGAIAGVLGGAAAVGLNIMQGAPNAVSEYWLDKLSLSGLTPQDPASALAVGGGVFLAAVLGGWIGSQLLPPLAPDHMRNKRLRLGGD